LLAGKRKSRRFRLLGRNLRKLIGVSINEKNEPRDLSFVVFVVTWKRSTRNRQQPAILHPLHRRVDADIDAASCPALGRFDA